MARVTVEIPRRAAPCRAVPCRAAIAVVLAGLRRELRLKRPPAAATSSDNAPG